MPIASKYEIRKLILPNGSCPFGEWYDELEEKEQYMVEVRLLRVRLGCFGEIRSVGAGVFELKFRKGRAMRVYYGQVKSQIVLLLMGGDKRTQTGDIKRARALFAEFKSGELKDAKC